MKLLDDDESLDLLCLHAFESKILMDGYEELAKQAVQYCEGNPLALEVLGSSLSEDTNIDYWKSALKLMGNNIHDDIYRILKRSYDLLQYNSDRELFLHIACFFVGNDIDYVVKILEPGYFAVTRIKTLIKRCLLYVTPNKKLMMHRLLQEMGRSLVDRESSMPAKRNRVWHNKESYAMLFRQKSSDTMKGLALDMHVLMEEDGHSMSSKLDTLPSMGSLLDMDELELLQLNHVKFQRDFEKDSLEHLRWLSWVGFNRSRLPFRFCLSNMVALDMSYSWLEIFEPPTVLQSLKILNLKSSRALTEIRSISLLPNLETLILWNCHKLDYVVEFKCLTRLEHIIFVGVISSS